jgi:hypothetical protein
MLCEFIALNRAEIIRRCRAKVTTRLVPTPTAAEIDHGVPLFLDQLVGVLRLGLSSSPDMVSSAVLHGATFCARASPCHSSSTIMATSASPSPSWHRQRARRSAWMSFGS